MLGTVIIYDILTSNDSRNLVLDANGQESTPVSDFEQIFSSYIKLS